MRKFVWAALALSVVCCGCQQPLSRERAASDAARSAGLADSAADAYRRLIVDGVRRGRDVSGLQYELGRLEYARGEFSAAADQLKQVPGAQAAGLRGMALFRAGEFTDALETFSSLTSPSDEHLYYHARTCEKLNLFDQALALYGRIRSPAFARQARERAAAIEKRLHPRHISEVDPAIAGLIRAAPPAENYPQAGALYLFVDEKERITPENKGENSMHYLIEILNERGKEQFSEMPIEYDSTYEKVELEYARTIKPDGTVAEVGTRHIRDVSKYLNFPLYSNARVFIISFPEIVEGAVIEYKARILRNQLVNKTDFLVPYSVQSAEPIVLQRFQLEMPASRKVRIKQYNARYNTFGAQLDPQVSRTPETVRYRWEFRDVPQVIPEPKMPPFVEVAPLLVVSSFGDWRSIYDWWWPLARDKIAADEDIRAAVAALVAGISSDREKAQAIYHFCAQKIRYVAVEYGQAGYEPHAARDIFRNKYGDCKDQAVLLVTMLREAGLRAWPVLIGTKEHFDLDDGFPAPLFNHAIACVELDGALVFMDPTAETCSFGDLPVGDQGRRVLVIKDNGYAIETIPLFPAERNAVRQEFRLALEPDEGLSGEKRIASQGIYDQSQRYWLLYTIPQQVEDTITAALQGISTGARLLEYRAEHVAELGLPVILHYRFSGPEFFVTGGPLRIMPQLGSLDASLVAKDKRAYPLEFGYLDTRETEYRIALPAGYSTRYIPETFLEDSPWMKMSGVYERKPHEIVFRQRIETKKVAVSREEYGRFKAFYETLLRRLKQRIILEKAQ